MTINFCACLPCLGPEVAGGEATLTWNSSKLNCSKCFYWNHWVVRLTLESRSTKDLFPKELKFHEALSARMWILTDPKSHNCISWNHSSSDVFFNCFWWNWSALFNNEWILMQQTEQWGKEPIPSITEIQRISLPFSEGSWSQKDRQDSRFG